MPDPRYMISIKGKLYLKYEGALQEAHARGLRELLVELIQVPGSENGNVAICRATAIFEPVAAGGLERRYIEYGDAAPNNTAPMIANALIRMAATRAKGRALRDAIGVGEALAEEIYDAPDHRLTPVTSQPTQPAPAPTVVVCAEGGCGQILDKNEIMASKKHAEAFKEESFCTHHGREMLAIWKAAK